MIDYVILTGGVRTTEGSGIFQQWVEARSDDGWEVQLDVSDDPDIRDRQIREAFDSIRKAFPDE